MTFTPEQLVAAHKANIETLFGLTHKAFEGVEKLIELNMQVAKTSLSEAAETTLTAMSVKDAQEFMSLQAGMLQPAAEKAAAYSRHLYDIIAGTNAEVTKAAEATLAWPHAEATSRGCGSHRCVAAAAEATRRGLCTMVWPRPRKPHQRR